MESAPAAATSSPACGRLAQDCVDWRGDPPLDHAAWAGAEREQRLVLLRSDRPVRDRRMPNDVDCARNALRYRRSDGGAFAGRVFCGRIRLRVNRADRSGGALAALPCPATLGT